MKAFPRRRLYQRHLTTTEDVLSSLPMVIFTPVIGAVVGAAWGTPLPIHEIVRRGAVIAQASFWHVLVFAALGALLGIVLVTVVIALASVASYRLRGDPAWKVRWELGEDTTQQGVTVRRNGVQLVCARNPPAHVATLGYVDAVVRLPTGDCRTMPQHGMGPLMPQQTPGSTTNGWWFPPVGSMHSPIPPGKYEVRWYGTTKRGQRFEVARGKHTVPTS